MVHSEQLEHTRADQPLLRRFAAGALVSVLALEATACSPPENRDDQKIEHFAVDNTPSPTAQSEALETVDDPWRPGDFQEGVQIFWHTVGDDAGIERQANEALDYIVDLEANSVGISFPFEVDGATPTTVLPGRETPTPRQLSLVVQEAKQRDLRVMLRPLMNEESITAENPSAWRGSIAIEGDKANWYQAYAKFLLPYLKMAEQQGVDEFVLGTELNSLQVDTAAWQELHNTAAEHYDGELSYSFNWNGMSAMPFKQLGMDMYPPLQLGDDASVSELTDGMTNWLEQLPTPDSSELTIQEVGIAAHDGAYAEPWRWGDPSEPVNEQVQANWFMASYRAARRVGAAGIYYWMVDSNIDLENQAEKIQQPGDFIGRQAEAVIKRVYK